VLLIASGTVVEALFFNWIPMSGSEWLHTRAHHAALISEVSSRTTLGNLEDVLFSMVRCEFAV